MPNKLKILIVSAEVSPFAKVGGLADVAGALPKYLKNLGHDVRIAMPCYKMIETNPAFHIKTKVKNLNVPLGWRNIDASVKQTSIRNDIPVYLISAPYFDESIDSNSVYITGSEPYAFFCKAVLEMLHVMKPSWKPDIIHCNDWHTGFLPVYKRVIFDNDPILSQSACIFTIHNLAYQGEFHQSILADYGLPEWLYSMDKLECYGSVNFLKAGIVFSNMVSTVSPTYACEVRTPEYGCRLDGLLAHIDEMGRLRGILNGLDYEVFNPATDKRIPFNYSLKNTKGKAKNKAALQTEMGLPVDEDVPAFGLITRLADQKGLDLIKAAVPQIMKLGVQLVVLGTGDAVYEKLFRRLEDKYPGQVKANIGFDAALAQRIYAGCDMFLMPSRFEPCGLGQLIALRYGTIPVVRATGGLADTIIDYEPGCKSSNGFVFNMYKPQTLTNAIERAVSTFKDKKAWSALMKTALSSDFSWNASADKYLDFYREALEMHSDILPADLDEIRSAA